MSRRAGRALLVVAVVVLAAAAPAGPALRPAAYRAEAAAACIAFRKGVEVNASDTTTRSGLIRLFRRAIPVAERYLVRLRALSPPTPLAALHRQVVSVVAAEVARVRLDLARLEAGAAPAKVLLDPVGMRLGERENDLWGRLGVLRCTT